MAPIVDPWAAKVGLPTMPARRVHHSRETRVQQKKTSCTDESVPGQRYNVGGYRLRGQTYALRKYAAGV